MLSALLEQEHYGFRFTDFVQGYYPDGHPTMPGMVYLKLKGSLITKGNKINGSAPTLFDSRSSRRLVNNPEDLLPPSVCMSCFLDLRTQIKRVGPPVGEPICDMGFWLSPVILV
jgi:hypothetical protein